MRIEVPLAGRTLYAQVWLAQVGRVPLLLLDSDVEQNSGYEREVTDRLYGGGTDHRLAQEVLLGHRRRPRHPRLLRDHRRGGPRGVPPQRGPRRASSAWSGSGSTWTQGMDFDTALERSRAGTVFTTHTPVPAGIDRFPRELIVNQFGNFDDVPLDRVLALGAEDYEGGDPSKFNMAVMGFRLGAAGQRCLGAARRGLPGDVPGAVAGLRHQRGADHLGHQRRAPPHLGAPGPARNCSRRRPAARRTRSSTATTGTPWPRSTATPCGP